MQERTIGNSGLKVSLIGLGTNNFSALTISYEIDIYDLSVGTPPHTLLIVSSEGHSTNHQLVPECIYFPCPGMHGTENPLVRADITYFNMRGVAAYSASRQSHSRVAWRGTTTKTTSRDAEQRRTPSVIGRSGSGSVNDLSRLQAKSIQGAMAPCIVSETGSDAATSCPWYPERRWTRLDRPLIYRVPHPRSYCRR